MAKNKRKRTAEEVKELNWKIAEIIWYSIGGVVLLGGLVFSILGLLVLNMDGNFNNHPLYPLYEAQGKFFEWLGFGSTYANAGLVLILCGIVYMLIVFYAFSKRAEVNDKKAKQKQTRKKNLKLIIEEETPVTD